MPGPSGQGAHAGTIEASPKILWRGEYGRHPYTALQEGGLYSWGYGFLSDDIFIDLEKGTSLYEHALGMEMANSVYVSTSADHKMAMRATHATDEAVPKDVRAYLYRIRPNRQAIPINRSLGSRSPFPDQDEYAFVGYVPDHQCDGFYTVTEESYDEILASIEAGGLPTRSEYYTSLPKIGRTVSEPSGPQYQLAGFPENDKAWDLPEYAKYKGQKTSEHLAEFLERELGSPQQAEVIRQAQGKPDLDRINDIVAPAPGDKSAVPPKSKKKSRFRNLLKKLVCKRSDVSCELGPEDEALPQTTEDHQEPKPEDVVIAEAKMQPSAKEPELTNSNELGAMAERISKSTFDNLMREYGHEKLMNQGELYTELTGRLSEFRPASRVKRIARLSQKIGEGVVGVAGLALYGKAVADVFSSDASVLDKAAVLTSVIPGVGCVVQAADNAQHGAVDATHTALCFTEDALMVSGFWEIALFMQLMTQLSDWVKEKDTQNELFGTDVLMQKCLDGWNHNIQAMLDHLESDEFIGNAITRFSAYQVTLLYQASQLAGDLHAVHAAISVPSNATNANTADQNVDLTAAIQTELRRHICVEMARSKLRLQGQLEQMALNHTVKLEHDYKERFLDDYLKAATKPLTFVFGIQTYPRPDLVASLKQDMDYARKDRLPLYEDEIKAAIHKAVDRLETPEPCQCVQGRKQRRCEFADCSSPRPKRGFMDYGGRIYVAEVLSEATGKRMGVSEECVALFQPCQQPGSSLETSRQLWCRPGQAG